MAINSVQPNTPVGQSSPTSDSKQAGEKPAQVSNQNQLDTVTISSAAKQASGSEKGTSQGSGNSGQSGT